MNGPLPDDAAAATILDPELEDDVLVRVQDLVKYFPVKSGGLISRTVGHVQAVDGVSLNIGRGQTLGLVGETGCGKSTLARCIAGLIPVTSGKVTFEGRDITNLSRRLRGSMRQMASRKTEVVNLLSSHCRK